MWKAAFDWINFSFKVWLAYLTAQILIFIMVAVGYVFVLLALYVTGVL